MWPVLQEFGVTHACGTVYTQHWRQLLQEFGAAYVCDTVYTQHWEKMCSPGSCRGCVYQLTSQCGEVNRLRLVCRSVMKKCDLCSLEGRCMCGLCCRNLVLLMRVALYTLSIGDKCCRNLAPHVCVILYTLSIEKTCVVQDPAEAVFISSLHSVAR